MMDNLHRITTALQEQRDTQPIAIAVPIAEAEVPNGVDGGDTVIYMDHPKLPPPHEFVFFDGSDPVQAHDLGVGLAYECFQQQNSGAFHLIGPPAVYSLGMLLPPSVLDSIGAEDAEVALYIYRVDSDGGEPDIQRIAVKGAAHAVFLMTKDDFFVLRFEPPPDADDPDAVSMDIPPDQFVILTRLAHLPNLQ